MSQHELEMSHSEYRQEVEQRWGKQAYANGNKWWRSMNETQRVEWKKIKDDLIADWREASETNLDPGSEAAQALANRQEHWLGSIPGTPGFGSGEVPAQYLLGLAEMYVADDRVAANYGGVKGAKSVR